LHKIRKNQKESLLFYVLIMFNVFGWGLIIYLKLADSLHGFGIEIGKAFAR